MKGRSRAQRSLGALFCLLLAVPRPGAAASGEKKIVALRSGNFPIYDFAVTGFEEGLKARRVPYALESLVLPSSEAEFPAFMESLQAKAPDLVLTIGTAATRELQERGGGLPFVYAMIVDPSSMGLRTGGAVMEVHPGMQLQFIKDNFPAMKKVGVIHSALRTREAVRLLQEETPEGLSLVRITAETPEDVSKAILRLSKEADCLLMVSDGSLYSPQVATQIILQTIQNDLPIIGLSPSFAKAGALAAIYPDYKDNGQQAAEAAARYFAGTPLASVPVQWPSKVQSAVNLIVAQRLGVSLQAKTVKQAQEVVK